MIRSDGDRFRYPRHCKAAEDLRLYLLPRIARATLAIRHGVPLVTRDRTRSPACRPARRGLLNPPWTWRNGIMSRMTHWKILKGKSRDEPGHGRAARDRTSRRSARRGNPVQYQERSNGARDQARTPGADMTRGGGLLLYRILT
jgi:hypothetical protein